MMRFMENWQTGTFKPLRDVNEEGTSYTLDQISDGTIEVTEVKIKSIQLVGCRENEYGICN